MQRPESLISKSKVYLTSQYTVLYLLIYYTRRSCKIFATHTPEGKWWGRTQVMKEARWDIDGEASSRLLFRCFLGGNNYYEESPTIVGRILTNGIERRTVFVKSRTVFLRTKNVNQPPARNSTSCSCWWAQTRALAEKNGLIYLVG